MVRIGLRGLLGAVVATGFTLLGAVVPADAADLLIPGRSTLVKPGAVAKFTSKGGFDLPGLGSADDPTVSGATLELFDVLTGGAGSATFTLDSSGWKGLGNPAGSKGFRYRAAKDTADPSAPCRSVVIRGNRISAICQGPAVTLSPPFLGDQGIILSSGGMRYCAQFGGQIRRNDSSGFRRTNSLPPDAGCLVQGTPTPTVPPTNTPTPTPTPGNPPPFIGTHQCDLDSSTSRLFLQLSSTGVLVRPSGSIEIDCGAVDGFGQADCTCELLSWNAVNLLGIGDICVTSSGPCDPGVTECLGGSGFDTDLVGDHNIGACATQAGCAAQCDSYCGGLGSGYSAQGASCEGFCQGGANEDLACTADSQCPGGHCPGKEPDQAGPHAGVCNCTCIGEGFGGSVPAGSMNCDMGLAITVEPDSNQICGDSTPSISLPPTCGSLTTATATGNTLHVNNTTSGEMGPLTVAGQHQSCEVLATGNTSGMSLVGHLQSYDSRLGDILIQEQFICQ